MKNIFIRIVEFIIIRIYNHFVASFGFMTTKTCWSIFFKDKITEVHDIMKILRITAMTLLPKVLSDHIDLKPHTFNYFSMVFMPRICAVHLRWIIKLLLNFNTIIYFILLMSRIITWYAYLKLNKVSTNWKCLI